VTDFSNGKFARHTNDLWSDIFGMPLAEFNSVSFSKRLAKVDLEFGVDAIPLTGAPGFRALWLSPGILMVEHAGYPDPMPGTSLTWPSDDLVSAAVNVPVAFEEWHDERQGKALYEIVPLV